MTESQKRKTKFRASAKWKKFRHFKNVQQEGKCFITGKKLLKGANLHHCNLDPNLYEDISEPDNFVYLNKSLHDVVHTLWRYYRKDKEVITRLEEVLEKMYQLNEENECGEDS